MSSLPFLERTDGLAGMPIGYALAPRSLADSLRKEGAGDAEGLGRLNLVAASAAVADTAQVVLDPRSRRQGTDALALGATRTQSATYR